jgi:hypothetical protein
MMTNVCSPSVTVSPNATSAELVAGGLGDLEAAADEQHEGEQHRRRAEQAELLADHHEHGIGRGEGDVLGPPEPSPVPGQAAGAEREEALDELVAGVLHVAQGSSQMRRGCCTCGKSW